MQLIRRISESGIVSVNRHHRRPWCGAPEGDLPKQMRWKVAPGVRRGARVATWGVRALLGLPSANDASGCEYF